MKNVFSIESISEMAQKGEAAAVARLWEDGLWDEQAAHPNQKYPSLFATRESPERIKPLYNVYCQMHARCSPNYRYAHRYWKRGIRVCEEWERSWPVFAAWAMANGYTPGLEIDRIDNDQGYSPFNCHFVTRRENSRNRDLLHLSRAVSQAKRKALGRVVQIETGRIFACQSDAAKALRISPSSINQVLKGKAKRAGGFRWKFEDKEGASL